MQVPKDVHGDEWVARARETGPVIQRTVTNVRDSAA